MVEETPQATTEEVTNEEIATPATEQTPEAEAAPVAEEPSEQETVETTLEEANLG